MNKIEKNISNLFAASLVIENSIQPWQSVDLSEVDTYITKYAGIYINQPSLDNIEQFLIKYVYSELGQLSKYCQVNVEIHPHKFSTTNSQYIDEATGLAKITINNDVTIEIPFLIVDGELSPFDVIQYNKQRVPYTRENLNKIVGNIILLQKQKNREKNSLMHPYQKLDNPTNPATSNGFLGNTLSIIDQNSRKSRDLYVTSSEKFKNVLEKVANMQPITEQEFNEITQELNKKVALKHAYYLYKNAQESQNISVNTAEILLKKFNNLNFVDIADVQHGQIIIFPEFDFPNKQLNATRAIVLEIFDWPFISGNNVHTTGNKLVLTEDGRYKYLSKGDHLLCLIDNNQNNFNAPLRTFKSLQEKDKFVLVNNNYISKPLVLDSIRYRVFSNISDDNLYPISEIPEHTNYNELKIKYYQIRDALKYLDPDTWQESINIFTLNNPKIKFDILPLNVFCRQKAMELVTDTDIIKLLVSGTSYNKQWVYVINEDLQKVIILKEELQDYPTSRQELDIMILKLNAEDDLFKSAATNNTITIKLVNPVTKTYNIQIEYVDQSRKMFNLLKKELKNIPESQVKEILSLLKFPPILISEILFKAKSHNFVKYELPKDADINKINVQPTNIMVDQVKQKASQIFDPSSIIEHAVGYVLGNMLIDLALTTNNKTLAQVLKTLSKFAQESEALSIAFEKIAQEKKDIFALNVAQIMAISSYFLEKVAKHCKGEDIYYQLDEIAEDILNLKPELEKIAADLIETKTIQYYTRTHAINPNYLTGAIRHITHLYKIAEAIKQSSMNKPTPEQAKKETVKDKNNGAYVKEIVCKVCNYKGVPTNDGHCPKCNSIMGEPPKSEINTPETSDKYNIPAELPTENKDLEQ